MTMHKHLKQLVRARMARTGESYAAARRHVVIRETPATPDTATHAHFPGNVAATTALRVLATHAGVLHPDTGLPFSESLLFGIAGGIGMGVFAFRYEKEDFSSFFAAGRHKWADDLDYLTAAARRLGLTPAVRESTSPGKAARDLEEALRDGPCVAWVDRARLPHCAFPSAYAGGAYHVVTVYRLGPEPGTALIGDLTDEPISIPVAHLAEARDGIKKQKNRLLSVSPGSPATDLPTLIHAGLSACVDELTEPSMKAARRNFQLGAIRTLAERMGGTGKESWQQNFRRGRQFWKGLTSLYDCVEHYGTGGGLCRPLFAVFLEEAASHVPSLRELAVAYQVIGQTWSRLAEAALPDEAPLLAESRLLLARKSELLAEGGDPAGIRAVWARLAELEEQAEAAFPLSEAECKELRSDLADRLSDLAEAEEAAFARLREVTR